MAARSPSAASRTPTGRCLTDRSSTQSRQTAGLRRPSSGFEGATTLSYAPSGGAFAFTRPRNGDENNGTAVYVSKMATRSMPREQLARNLDFYTWLPDGKNLLLVGGDGTHSVMWEQAVGGRAKARYSGRRDRGSAECLLEWGDCLRRRHAGSCGRAVRNGFAQREPATPDGPQRFPRLPAHSAVWPRWIGRDRTASTRTAY